MYRTRFILYDGFKAEQLGRLIRRLHVAAELRMAALVDIEQLRRASDAVRDAGQVSTLNELNDRYARIGNDCAGGLVYRINRSRYYAGVYRDRLQDLRIVRIEGWQPYDEFVQRTLYRDFEFVDQLGQRHAQLGERISRLVGKELADNIQKNQRASLDVQSELMWLQTFAEPIGTAAFIYYVGQVFFAVWTTQLAMFPSAAILGTLLWLGTEKPGIGAYILSAFIYAVVRTVFVWVRNKRTPLLDRLMLICSISRHDSRPFKAGVFALYICSS